MLPVVVLVLSGVGAFIYGAAVAVHSVADIADHPFAAHNLRLFLTEIDLFLIGATLIIAAIGLYELFVARIDPANLHRPLPAWLEMNDLNDLKARVIAMIILVVAVTFTDVLLEFPRKRWSCSTWLRASRPSSSRSPSTSGSAPTTVVITHDGRRTARPARSGSRRRCTWRPTRTRSGA